MTTYHQAQLISDTDVIIQAGKEPNIKAFQAHSAILRAQSPYFEIAFSTTWARREGNRIVLKKPNVSPTVFGMLLDYLYDTKVNLDGQDGFAILDLLVAADELLIVQDLLGRIQDHLIHKKTEWLEKNFGLVLHTIFRHDTCKQLQDYCLIQMCWRPELVFESDDFLDYDEELVILVLSQDDLQMEEKDILDNLIRWGINQIPSIEHNISRWTSDDFADLHDTLRNCLPLIRFTTDFPPSEFIQKVRSPFDTTLLLSSPRRPIIDIDSTIIHPVQAAHLPEWIDSTKKTPSRDLIRLRYDFKLLVRGTRDGFTPAVFHKHCDNQGPNFVISRIKGTGQIIGGYNPIGWRGLEKSRWLYTQESFLFSFAHYGDLNDIKVSRIMPGNEAIYDDPKFGPCFGKTDIDMRIEFDKENNCSARRQCYKHSITNSTQFAVDEYEVFKIVLH